VEIVPSRADCGRKNDICFVCFLVRYASNITEIVITGATRERFIVIPGGS